MQASGSSIRKTIDPSDIEQAIRFCNQFDYIHVRPELSPLYKGSPELSLGSPSSSPVDDTPIQSCLDVMSQKVEKTRARRSRNDAQHSSSNITRDAFGHLVAVQCLSAAHEDFVFAEWADQFSEGIKLSDSKLSDAVQDVLDLLGVNEEHAAKVYGLYTLPAVCLSRDILHTDPSEGSPEYAHLKIIIHNLYKCHRLVVTDEIDMEAQVCFVSQTTPKSDHQLSVLELITHNVAETTDDTHKPNEYPVKWVLSTRYAVFCHALWYLVHAEELVGAAFLQWKDAQSRQDKTFAKKWDPIKAVHTFTKQNQEFIDDMHRTILSCYDVVIEERKRFDRRPGAKAAKDKDKEK